jgi:hypothetical protein
MALNDPVDNRKPDARPLVFIMAVGALEDAKEFVVISHVEPNAIIFDIVP